MFDDSESITWTTDGAKAGSVFFHKAKKFSLTNVCGRLVVDDVRFDAKYVYYQLAYRAKAHVNYGMGNPKLMANQMAGIKIPLVTGSEQSEIVRKLDGFESLLGDLSSGLPAELAARRKHYEYYRDKLLTFEEVT